MLDKTSKPLSGLPCTTYSPAGEESQQGGPEGAAGEAVDDEVDARVEHEGKVVDAGERGRGRGDSIHSDLVLHCTQQDDENEMIAFYTTR